MIMFSCLPLVRRAREGGQNGHGAWVKQIYGVEMVLLMLSLGQLNCMYHKNGVIDPLDIFQDYILISGVLARERSL